MTGDSREWASLPKVAVILGAGANIGIQGLTGHIKAGGGDWHPPLAADLFGERLRGKAWSEVIAHYPPAVEIAERIALRMNSGGELGLEQYLREFADASATKINYRFVPAFLRDLFYSVSHKHVTSPGTLISLVGGLLAGGHEPHHHVAFITLNYDNFLEQALGYRDSSVYRFSGIGDYVREDRQAKVFKLHGSIDWVAPFGGAGDWWAEVRTLDEPIEALAKRVEVGGEGADRIKGYRRGGLNQYPILTAPLAGKGPDSIVCPDDHKAKLLEFLVDCRKLLIIGNSGRDDDLHSLLGKGLTKLDAIHIVDEDEDRAREIEKRFADKVEPIRLALARKPDPRFEYHTAQGKGLPEYVGSAEFVRFLRHDPT